MAMNTNIFNEDFTALFEEDEQYLKTYEDLLRHFSDMNTDSENKRLLQLWDDVIQSEAQIDEKMRRLPGNKALDRSIKQQKDALATAEKELTEAKNNMEEKNKALKTQRRRIYKMIDEAEPAVCTSLVQDDQSLQAATEYRAKIASKRKSLLAKKNLLVMERERGSPDGKENRMMMDS